MAVVAATPYGNYRYASPYYSGIVNYGTPSAYTATAPVAVGTIPTAGGLFSFNGTVNEASATLIKAGVQPLTLAANKLNELSEKLPETLANIDPSTKGDIAKVNGIINEICAKAVAEIKPTSYLKYTPEGLKEMCDYIAKIGSDILGGLDNPAIFQKYTADLQKAILALNAKAIQITEDAY